jgi:hypothetical protein
VRLCIGGSGFTGRLLRLGQSDLGVGDKGVYDDFKCRLPSNIQALKEKILENRRHFSPCKKVGYYTGNRLFYKTKKKIILSFFLLANFLQLFISVFCGSSVKRIISSPVKRWIFQ